MAYEKYVIEDFMSAWFEKNYSVITEEEFKIVYAEYLDTSGLFLSDEFERRAYIQHLHSRINAVRIYVRIQREFLQEFDVPYSLDFERFKFKYGYNLIWKNDKDEFESQLKKVEKREQKFVSTLEEKIKELIEARKSQSNSFEEDEEELDKSLKKGRVSFIRMLNSLSKIGYRIDKKSTTVEELALMIKQQMEESEEYASKTSSFGR